MNNDQEQNVVKFFTQCPNIILYGLPDVAIQDKWVLLSFVGICWMRSRGNATLKELEGPYKLSLRDIEAITGIQHNALRKTAGKNPREGVLGRLQSLGYVTLLEGRPINETTGKEGRPQTYLYIHLEKLWCDNLTFSESWRMPPSKLVDTGTFTTTTDRTAHDVTNSVHPANSDVHHVTNSVHDVSSDVHSAITVQPANSDVHPANSDAHHVTNSVHDANSDVHPANSTVHDVNHTVHPANSNGHMVNHTVHDANTKSALLHNYIDITLKDKSNINNIVKDKSNVNNIITDGSDRNSSSQQQTQQLDSNGPPLPPVEPPLRGRYLRERNEHVGTGVSSAYHARSENEKPTPESVEPPPSVGARACPRPDSPSTPFPSGHHLIAPHKQEQSLAPTASQISPPENKGPQRPNKSRRTSASRDIVLTQPGEHILDLYDGFKGRKAIRNESTLLAANRLGEVVGSDEDFMAVLRAIANDPFLKHKQVRTDLDFVYRKYDGFLDLVEHARGRQLPGVSDGQTDYNAVVGMTDEQRAAYKQAQQEKLKQVQPPGVDRQALMNMTPEERIFVLKRLREQQPVTAAHASS